MALTSPSMAKCCSSIRRGASRGSRKSKQAADCFPPLRLEFLNPLGQLVAARQEKPTLFHGPPVVAQGGVAFTLGARSAVLSVPVALGDFRTQL